MLSSILAAHVCACSIYCNYSFQIIQRAMVLPIDLEVWWTCFTRIFGYCRWVGSFIVRTVWSVRSDTVCVLCEDFLVWDILVWLTWILFIESLRALLKPKVCGSHEKHLGGDIHRSSKRNLKWTSKSFYNWFLKFWMMVEILLYKNVRNHDIVTRNEDRNTNYQTCQCDCNGKKRKEERKSKFEVCVTTLFIPMNSESRSSLLGIQAWTLGTWQSIDHYPWSLWSDHSVQR